MWGIATLTMLVSSSSSTDASDTVTAMMLLQVPTLYLFWKYMPETKGHELVDVAR